MTCAQSGMPACEGLTLSWLILMAVLGESMAFTPAASAPLHSPLPRPACALGLSVHPDAGPLCSELSSQQIRY